MRILATLMTIAGLLAGATAAANDEARARELWSELRDAHPYHVQVVAVSTPESDGRRSLILSEPPPHVSLASIRALDPALGAARVERHEVGVDGWVSDVVATLPAMTDGELRTLVDRIQQHLFQTTYKAHVTTLPLQPRSTAKPQPLDVRVSAAELDAWVIRGDERFRPLLGGRAVSVPDVLRSKATGVFVSVKPGLVVWALPRGADLRRYMLEARQFALDSDLVLGAVADRRHVAIVARERMVPLADLPMLRAESILLLAGVNTDELAQSYERQNLFSGKTVLGLDWAPIYLSDALIDTEYGSLLNITDQLLQSWSMNGQVEYFNFDYPAPATWPFPKPLNQALGVSHVTFNWNTKGAGYVVQSGEYSILALNRTGALPVSYLASSSTLNQYEETAYEYFASRNDPNLVRVVQYAALYKIFREFGIRAPGQAPGKHEHPEQRVLAAQALVMLETLDGADTAQVAEWTRLPEAPAQLQQPLRTAIAAARKEIALVQSQWGEAGLQALAARIANPRLDDALLERLAAAKNREEAFERLSPVERRNLILALIARKFTESPLNHFLQVHFIDINRAVAEYAPAAVRDTVGSIRTPSIVLSTVTGENANLVGGHNLDSRVLHYRSSPDVQPGKVRIVAEDGRSVILHNPKDLSKLEPTLRRTAIELESPRLKEIVEAELAKAPPVIRSRPQALAFPEREPSGNRGLLSAHTDRQPVPDLGWRPMAEAAARKPPSVALAGDLNQLGVPSLVIERTSDGTYRVAHAASEVPLTASSYVGLTDMTYAAMRGRAQADKPFQLHFMGFSESETSAFLRTMEVKFAKGERPALAGITPSGRMTSVDVPRVLRLRPDFQRARVTEIVRMAESSRPGLHEVRATVELPLAQPGTPSLFLRLRMFFREQVIEPSREAVLGVVRRAFGGGERATTANVDTAIMAIKRELKALHPAIDDVTIRYESDAGDLLIIRLDEDDSTWTSRDSRPSLASAR